MHDEQVQIQRVHTCIRTTYIFVSQVACKDVIAIVLYCFVVVMQPKHCGNMLVTLFYAIPQNMFLYSVVGPKYGRATLEWKENFGEVRVRAW